jgi:hypothetical protein
MLDAAQQAFVTRVFEWLGPERVARGRHAQGHGWVDCFFALAYGEIGELQRLMPGPNCTSEQVGRAVGIPAEVANGAVMRFITLWDDPTRAHTRDIRALAAWWLEEQPQVRRSAALVPTP